MRKQSEVTEYIFIGRDSNGYRLSRKQMKYNRKEKSFWDNDVNLESDFMEVGEQIRIPLDKIKEFIDHVTK